MLSPMVMLLEQSDVIICPKRLSLNSFGAVHKLHMFFFDKLNTVHPKYKFTKNRPGNLDNARPFCAWLLDYFHACLPRKCIFVVNILCDNVMQIQKISWSQKKVYLIKSAEIKLIIKRYFMTFVSKHPPYAIFLNIQFWEGSIIFSINDREKFV